MTLKRYQAVRTAVSAILAMFVGSSIVRGGYVLPIVAVVAGSLILLLLRRRVKEIMADERDRAVAGQAAFWAMQVYCWFAALLTLVLFANRAANPAYEPVSMALGYSACFLMFTYTIIFKYHNRLQFLRRKALYAATLALLIAILIVVGLRLLSGEDDWICQNGQWVRHGAPDFPAPTVECR